MTDQDAGRRAYEAGRALAELGRHEEAREQFERASTLDPTAADIWRAVARNRHELDDWPGMLAAADRAVALSPHSGDAHLLRAVALNDLRRYPEALAAARRAVRCEPKSPLVWRRLAYQRYAAGQPAKAVKAVKKARRLDPSYAPGWSMAGLIALRRGDAVKAERLYRRALRLEPDNLEALDGLADALRAQGRLTRATAITRQIMRSNAAYRPRVVGDLASDLADAGKVGKAVKLLGTAIEGFPRRSTLRRVLVEVLLDAGRRPDALEEARRAVADLPGQAESWIALGVALPPDHPEALPTARRATEIDPTVAGAWFLLGKRLRQHGDLDGAAAAAIRAAAVQPGLPGVQHVASTRLRCLGHPEPALACAERAARLAPRDADQWHELAGALMAVDRVDDALAAVRTAARLGPDDPYNWMLLTEVAMLAGVPDDARTGARRTAELDDDHLTGEARGFAAWLQDDRSTAHAEFGRALADEPNCCCGRLARALTAPADAPPPNVTDLVAPIAGSDEDDETDARCTDASCWMRARLADVTYDTSVHNGRERLPSGGSASPYHNNRGPGSKSRE